MVELEESRERLRQQGFGLAAISYDPVGVLRSFAERRRIRFPLLSDSQSQAIRAFGVLNQEVPREHAYYGIPHPVTFIVDRGGVVTAKYFVQDVKQRFTLSGILVRHFGQDPAVLAGAVETRHLKATWKASAGVVRPGQRIALVIELELKPRMHVYAPGVEGYKPLAWEMGASAAWQAHPVEFPPARTMRLEAIDETVPVFEGRVKLERDVTIGPREATRAAAGAQQGRLRLEGVLRYQACDDRQCYLPEAIPLDWLLRFEDVDLERTPRDLRRQPAQ